MRDAKTYMVSVVPEELNGALRRILSALGPDSEVYIVGRRETLGDVPAGCAEGKMKYRGARLIESLMPGTLGMVLVTNVPPKVNSSEYQRGC